MAKLSNYEGYTEVLGGLTRSGTEDFPLAEAHDIMVDEDDTRLDEKLSEFDEYITSLKTMTSRTLLTGFLNLTHNSIDYAVYFSRIVPAAVETCGTISAILGKLKLSAPQLWVIPMTGYGGIYTVLGMYYDASGEWYLKVHASPSLLGTEGSYDVQDISVSECTNTDYTCSCHCDVLIQ